MRCQHEARRQQHLSRLPRLSAARPRSARTWRTRSGRGRARHCSLGRTESAPWKPQWRSARVGSRRRRTRGCGVLGKGGARKPLRGAWGALNALLSFSKGVRPAGAADVIFWGDHVAFCALLGLFAVIAGLPRTGAAEAAGAGRERAVPLSQASEGWLGLSRAPPPGGAVGGSAVNAAAVTRGSRDQLESLN